MRMKVIGAEKKIMLCAKLLGSEIISTNFIYLHQCWHGNSSKWMGRLEDRKKGRLGIGRGRGGKEGKRARAGKRERVREREGVRGGLEADLLFLVSSWEARFI